MSFNSLGLSAPILKAITKQGYTEPTPIQIKAIPQVLQGRDVLASAQTGTGKTAGFTLPMLEIISSNQKQDKGRRKIKGLILTPTRELAAQIYDNIKAYSQFLDIRSTVIYGGVKQGPQVDKLHNGIDILVATPGRLLDLHNQKKLRLNDVDFFVLDEADRMLDMGFARDINKIIDLLPKERQNLLFSATFSKEIKALANKFLKNPIQVEATPENTTAEKVHQKMIRVDNNKKKTLLIKMIKEENWGQVLIFMRTKWGANKLSEKLNKSEITSAPIHGNKSQNARMKALKGFKDEKIQVLVATDIAARGIDIPLLPHVVNYELPNVPEDYVHRIGRTGRAGESGEAISFVSIDEVEYVRNIEKLLDCKFNLAIIEGFEPQDTAPSSVKPHQNNPNKHRNKKRDFKKKSNPNKAKGK